MDARPDPATGPRCGPKPADPVGSPALLQRHGTPLPFATWPAASAERGASGPWRKPVTTMDKSEAEPRPADYQTVCITKHFLDRLCISRLTDLCKSGFQEIQSYALNFSSVTEIFSELS